jgi:hypothetical protein
MREAACSVDIFVRISKTARYQDTEENNLNKNKPFSMGDITSRVATGSAPTDTPYCL